MKGFLFFVFFFFLGIGLKGCWFIYILLLYFGFQKGLILLYMVGSASVTKSLKMFVMSWKWSKDELTLLELVELVLIAV